MEQWLNTPVIVIVVLAMMGGAVRLGRWMGEVNTDRTNFKEFMREIRDDIKDIRQEISRIFGRLPPSSVADGSPLRLTDLGESISASLEARDWAARTARELAAQVEGKLPYEIQDFCYEYVANFTPTPEQEVKIRMSAYERGVDREQVMNVLVIELRDQLLELVGSSTAA